MLYDECIHHRHRNSGNPLSCWSFFDQRWSQHAMGANLHGPWSQGCLAISLLLLPAPSVLERNQCPATNFLKETNGSTTISIAKQKVPCTRVSARHISERPTMVCAARRIFCMTYHGLRRATNFLHDLPWFAPRDVFSAWPTTFLAETHMFVCHRLQVVTSPCLAFPPQNARIRAAQRLNSKGVGKVMMSAGLR